MKTKDLKAGEFYKCLLSEREILVVETEKVTKDEEGNDVKESVLAGKIYMNHPEQPRYIYIELHDGQLIELEN